jgi:hypothetical protein
MKGSTEQLFKHIIYQNSKANHLPVKDAQILHKLRIINEIWHISNVTLKIQNVIYLLLCSPHFKSGLLWITTAQRS